MDNNFFRMVDPTKEFDSRLRDEAVLEYFNVTAVNMYDMLVAKVYKPTVPCMINKEASWLYAELKLHISFLAKSHENSLLRLFLNETFQKVSLSSGHLMTLCGSSLMRLLKSLIKWCLLNEILWQLPNETFQKSH